MRSRLSRINETVFYTESFLYVVRKYEPRDIRACLLNVSVSARIFFILLYYDELMRGKLIPSGRFKFRRSMLLFFHFLFFFFFLPVSLRSFNLYKYVGTYLLNNYYLVQLRFNRNYIRCLSSGRYTIKLFVIFVHTDTRMYKIIKLKRTTVESKR